MLYKMMHVIAKPTVTAIWRPDVVGRENVPLEGPFVLASNHLSFADSVVIPLTSPRKVSFLAKEDYFVGTGVKGYLSKQWFTAVDAIPVDRDDARAAQKSLDQQMDRLREGSAVGIYPEGTRSRDGRIYRGKTGVAWLALTAGCPVVPVALSGTDKLWPVDRKMPRRVKFRVEFGAPIDFTGRFDGVPAGRARRKATDEVMAAIQAMSGQEEAGTFNQRAIG